MVEGFYTFVDGRLVILFCSMECEINKQDITI